MNNIPNIKFSERLLKKSAWNLVFMSAAVLLVVFIFASVDLVRTAIRSQPACVDHERVGTHADQARAPAAKSAC